MLTPECYPSRSTPLSPRYVRTKNFTTINMLTTDAIPPADIRLPVDQVLNGAPSGLGRAINKPRRPKFSGARGVGRLSLRSDLHIRNTNKGVWVEKVYILQLERFRWCHRHTLRPPRKHARGVALWRPRIQEARPNKEICSINRQRLLGRVGFSRLRHRM